MKAFQEMEVTPHPLLNPDRKIFTNDKYQVDVEELPDGWQWLSIKRKDKEAIHDWRELQQIKNLLVGDEREALELYPAESRLVDSSNQFHLFVMPEGDRFPYGYFDRLVVKGHKGGWTKGSQQRDFADGEEPTDAQTIEQQKEAVKQLSRYDNENTIQRNIKNVRTIRNHQNRIT